MNLDEGERLRAAKNATRERTGPVSWDESIEASVRVSKFGCWLSEYADALIAGCRQRDTFGGMLADYEDKFKALRGLLYDAEDECVTLRAEVKRLTVRSTCVEPGCENKVAVIRVRRYCYNCLGW